MRFTTDKNYKVFVYTNKGVITLPKAGYQGKDDMIWHAREAAWARNLNVDRIRVYQEGYEQYPSDYTHTGKLILGYL